jgi:hypothetical protein
MQVSLPLSNQNLDHLKFTGRFYLNRRLDPMHQAYLKRFHDLRHMIWDTKQLQALPDSLREAVGLPLGEQGMYFVASTLDLDSLDQHPAIIDDSPYTRYLLQASLPTVIDHTKPLLLVPGLWCGWMPNEKGTALIWDGEEKFYAFADWVTFLIEHFFVPWHYTLNGTVAYKDNQFGIDDIEGALVVTDNGLACEEHERPRRKRGML